MAAKVDEPLGKHPALQQEKLWSLGHLPKIGVARLLSAAVVVLFLLFGGFLWWEHAQAVRQATLFAEQITKLLAENLGRGLSATDVVLDQAIEQLQGTEAEEGSDASLRAQLLSATARVPFISAIRVTEPEGGTLAEVIYEAGPDFSLYGGLRDNRLRLPDGTLIGRLSGGERPAIIMARSFLGASGAEREVAVAIDPSYFTRLLPGQDRGAPYRLLVFDEDGRTLIEHAKETGTGVTRTPEYLLDRLTPRDQTVLRSEDGEIIVVRKLMEQPLYVAVALPLHLVQLQWASSGWLIWAVAFGSVLLLAVVLLLAARQAREQERLSSSLARLNESLESRVKLRTQELERLLTEKEMVSRDLARSLRQKDVLFREVHHRVKNNLQVINSLLSLQAGRASAELRPFLEESRRRLLAMRRLHEQLYQRGDGTALELGVYLSSMAEEMIRSFGMDHRVRLVAEVEEIRISLDQATPVALLVTEVLSNALKYAFPDDRRGSIILKLGEKNGTVDLEIRDDGVGLPPESKPREGQGLGRMLVRLLAKQLRGQAEYRGEECGTLFHLTFPRAALGRAEELEAAQ